MEYNKSMIKSFKHKGLRKFFTDGNLSGIQTKHAEKLHDQLAFLNVALNVEDLRKPGYRLHKLTGNHKDRWSIRVSGNWRVTFEFIDEDVYIVDYEDYH